MKLYWFATPNAHKPCAVARYLDAPVEFVHLDLGRGEQRSKEFLAINPNGKVPALVDGDLALWEAQAIMCHLAQRMGSDLWPKQEHLQVEVIRWFSWEQAHFSHQGGRLFFEHAIKPHFGLGETDAGIVADADRQFRVYAEVLDRHLQQRAWLLGDCLSLADFSTAAMLPYAQAARLPLDGFEHIQRWHAQLQQLPAWREPFPAPIPA